MNNVLSEYIEAFCAQHEKEQEQQGRQIWDTDIFTTGRNVTAVLCCIFWMFIWQKFAIQYIHLNTSRHASRHPSILWEWFMKLR